MNHVRGRAFSDKDRIVNIFNKQLKTTDKNCCSVNRFTANYKCLRNCNVKDEQYKMKRLKSRKERRQMRGSGREASSFKSHYHHCCHQSNKDIGHLHTCCHSSYHCPSRKDAHFTNVIPAAQEPSIITDSRLIGHQGLFNHEVKSIDIERLLSEQKKLEKSGLQLQKKSNATSHPSSTSGIPSSFISIDLLGADTDEVMQFEKEAGPTTKVHDDCHATAKKISQGSDLTPGQRPQQQLDLSSGSFKSILSSKHSSPVVIIKSEKTNLVMSGKSREAQLTPPVNRKNVKTLNKKVKRHMISTLEHTPKNQDSPVLQTQAHGLRPSLPQLSSSHTADSFDVQHRKQDPNCVSMSVSAVAEDLCDRLQFPLLRRRSLVAESREVLLKALQERHGPQLQENLLKVQQSLRFGADPTKEVQDREPIMEDVDEILLTDAFLTVFQANAVSQPRIDNQKKASLKLKRRRHFNWKPSPQLCRNMKQTAEWLKSPVETSASLLDDIFRPTSSPQFCMDFEPYGVTTSDHLFAPSPTSCWEEQSSASQHWNVRFNRPKSQEAVMFGSFENSFMNHTRAVTERSSGLQYNDSNIQSIFPYQAQLPHKHSAELMHFPQKQDRFETDRYSFAPSFPAQIHNPQQSTNFQPFSPSSHPSTCPSLRSYHTDMVHYPPSHILERDPAPPLCSFPSPEHWSFPPMRLY